jgi:hypothetical protein
MKAIAEFGIPIQKVKEMYEIEGDLGIVAHVSRSFFLVSYLFLEINYNF